MGWRPAGGSFAVAGEPVIVTYTATGAEGTDFVVPIASSMPDALYAVAMQSAGGASGDGTEASAVELADIPIAGRTTTQFRVLIGAALAAGDVLQFILTEGAS